MRRRFLTSSKVCYSLVSAHRHLTYTIENPGIGLRIGGRAYRVADKGTFSTGIVERQASGSRQGGVKVEAVGRASNAEGVGGIGKDGKTHESKVEKKEEEEGPDRPTKRVKVEHTEEEGPDRPIKREYGE